MPASYKVLDHRDLEGSLNLTEMFALDVLMGLSETPKKIPSKYFYDAEGSRLFQAITDLPEYYIPQSEAEIFQTQKEKISDLVAGESFNLIELGPGDGQKTNILLEYFLEKRLDFQYVPLDISESAMAGLIDSLNHRFKGLRAFGVVSDYFNGLKWLNKIKTGKSFLLFLGSNIGNFHRSRALAFLRNLWTVLNHNDYLLIGFDLKKDIDLMLKAYNDSKGITSQFNLNLLRRINRELGGNFDLSRFVHFAHYDVFSGAMESYLVSRVQQTVFIEAIGRSFSFDPWEPIHTEYSYKYLDSDIRGLAEETGFRIETELYDSRRFFTDSIWCVHKPSKNDQV